MTLRWRRRRLPAWALIGLTGASLVISGQAIRVFAADPVYPASLIGAGDSDVMGEMIDWQDALFASSQPTDIQYFQRGSRDSRGQLLRGQADFAIGGVPFTPAELASRASDAGEILTVPLSVGSTAIAVGEPARYGWQTEVLPCSLEDYFLGLCDYVPGPPLETVRIPPETLSAFITGQSDRKRWTDPDFVAALGTADLKIQQGSGSHTFLNRTEGATQNKYLMEYAQTLGPLAWAETLARDPGFAWEPIGEVFSPRTPSKFGMDTQLGLMSQSNDPISNQSPDSWTGNMGPVPTTLITRFFSDYPQRKYRVAQIQNANGDWVVPDRASIDASLAAGTDPIIATKQSIPGAYPLVFINNLFTVAGTLSPSKANALAAFVRYVVTDGQQLVIADGSTDLPDALRDEALGMADQIIVKNCIAPEYEVTTSGPSAFEPATPQVQALTGLKHCTLKPAPPTTTTTTTTTTLAPSTTTTTTTTLAPTTSVIVASSANTPSRTVSAATTSPPLVETTTTTTLDSSTTTTTVAVATTTMQPPSEGGGGIRPRGVALSQLPLVKPQTGAEEATRLGTFMLGAALFLLIRRLAQMRTAVA